MHEGEATPGTGEGASPADGANDAPAGAGRWVESSWDLRQGLTVSEGLPADAGLDEWIEAALRSD